MILLHEKKNLRKWSCVDGQPTSSLAARLCSMVVVRSGSVCYG